MDRHAADAIAIPYAQSGNADTAANYISNTDTNGNAIWDTDPDTVGNADPNCYADTDANADTVLCI